MHFLLECFVTEKITEEEIRLLQISDFYTCAVSFNLLLETIKAQAIVQVALVCSLILIYLNAFCSILPELKGSLTVK